MSLTKSYLFALMLLLVYITFINSNTIQRNPKESEETKTLEDDEEIDLENYSFLFVPVTKTCPEGHVWIEDIKQCRKKRKHG